VTHGFQVGPPILGPAWIQNHHRLLGDGNAAGGPFPTTTGLRLARFFLPLLQAVLGMGSHRVIW
jgi:hypothetical protein